MRGEGMSQCVSCRHMSIWLYSLLFHHGARPVTSPTPSNLVYQLRRVGACGFCIVFLCFPSMPWRGWFFLCFVWMLWWCVLRDATCWSVCFLVVFARYCMFIQTLLLGKPAWFKFCQVVCPRSQNPDRRLDMRDGRGLTAFLLR